MRVKVMMGNRGGYRDVRKKKQEWIIRAKEGQKIKQENTETGDTERKGGK